MLSATANVENAIRLHNYRATAKNHNKKKLTEIRSITTTIKPNVRNEMHTNKWIGYFKTIFVCWSLVLRIVLHRSAALATCCVTLNVSECVRVFVRVQCIEWKERGPLILYSLWIFCFFCLLVVKPLTFVLLYHRRRL